MSRFGSLGTQYFDSAGDPLINGLIYTYETGTTTLKDTYADFTLLTLNANPVVLTAAGRQPNIWFNGSAKMILATSAGVQIEVRDPVGTEAGVNVSFSEWSSGDTFLIGDLVRGSDGYYYVSLTGANTGNDPISTPASWTRVKFIRSYNSVETYAIGDIAQAATNGLLYISLTDSNTGNEPSGDAVNWGPAVATSSGGNALVYNSLTITATTTHSWPTGFADTVLVSGSGGGGGGASLSGDGGTGGTGAVSCARVPMFIDQSVTASSLVTIGSGGPGGAAGVNAGSPGGVTTIADLISLAGGGAGLTFAAGTSPSDGADGSETVEAVGPSGEGGRYYTGGAGGQGNNVTNASGGDGGASMIDNYRVNTLDNTGLGGAPSGQEGGGGGGSFGNGGAASVPTANRGGGGRGGDGSLGAQTGADGFILLEWWAAA